MKTLQDIANLIEIRNHLSLSVNNETIKLTREQLKSIDARVKVFDKLIVEHSLNVDLSTFGKEEPKIVRQSFTRESTEDTEVVARKFGVLSKPVVDEKGTTTVLPPPDKE